MHREFKEHVDRGCPLVLGGPLPHVMAAKAVAFTEALQPEFATYAHQIVDNARALARSLCPPGTCTCSPAGPTTTCWSSTSPRPTASPAARPKTPSAGAASL